LVETFLPVKWPPLGVGDGDNHNGEIVREEENRVGKNAEQGFSRPARVNHAKGGGSLANFS